MAHILTRNKVEQGCVTVVRSGKKVRHEMYFGGISNRNLYYAKQKVSRLSIASPIILVLMRYDTGESWCLTFQPVYPINKIQAQKNNCLKKKTKYNFKILSTTKTGAGNGRKQQISTFFPLYVHIGSCISTRKQIKA